MLIKHTGNICVSVCCKHTDIYLLQICFKHFYFTNKSRINIISKKNKTSLSTKMSSLMNLYQIPIYFSYIAV